MRITTFNVNGVRAIRTHYRTEKDMDFDAFLEYLKGDIICFQEHKTNQKDKLDPEIIAPRGFRTIFAFPAKRLKIGYSGVATYIKFGIEVYNVECGFTGTIDENVIEPESLSGLKRSFSDDVLKTLDSEGRCIIVDFGLFILLNVYFPNDGGPSREEYRMCFYEAVRSRIIGLRSCGKNVLIVGDINTTYLTIDHFEFSELAENPKSLEEFERSPCRRWLKRLLNEDGFVDLFRKFHPDRKGAYTCWNQKTLARSHNLGTRIDVAICDETFSQCIEYGDIQPQISGSDHCPAYVILNNEMISSKFEIGRMAPSINAQTHFKSRQTRLDSFFTRQSA